MCRFIDGKMGIVPSDDLFSKLSYLDCKTKMHLPWSALK